MNSFLKIGFVGAIMTLAYKKKFILEVFTPVKTVHGII